MGSSAEFLSARNPSQLKLRTHPHALLTKNNNAKRGLIPVRQLPQHSLDPDGISQTPQSNIR